ncbi:unnamed protein product [Didymodactylos carnosus]|uniref:Uncharacterized protein n=1 Tax=Didymodactylos carnosus TaxID=1234261 RepID=A0A814V0H4_9BILA|nr:unnamed protein product [Didymodactylos carnosus]CAF1180319.1 unnamed protein product [Didymodactylos carnosus]CAF3778338.1 unnamed protein product [Didymodactylos carnosus]CAF3944575.1 unnamed protein product [Didymodactylos carnosus]
MLFSTTETRKMPNNSHQLRIHSPLRLRVTTIHKLQSHIATAFQLTMIDDITVNQNQQQLEERVQQRHQ